MSGCRWATAHQLAGATKISARKEIGVSHVTLNTSFDVRHHHRINGTSLTHHREAIRLYIDAVGDLVSVPTQHRHPQPHKHPKCAATVRPNSSTR